MGSLTIVAATFDDNFFVNPNWSSEVWSDIASFFRMIRSRSLHKLLWRHIPLKLSESEIVALLFLMIGIIVFYK